VKGGTVSLDTRYQRSVIWLYIPCQILAFLAMIYLSWIIPPVPPQWLPTEVVEFYRSHTNMFRSGMAVLMIGAIPMVPFFMLITAQMQRIARCPAFLPYTQMGAALGYLWLTILGPMLYFSIAFRPEARSPELMAAFQDLAWLMQTVPFGLVIVQQLAVGFAIFADDAARPVFPRWVGYVSIMTALSYFVSQSIPFFPTGGPFGWSGLISYWVPLCSIGVFEVTMIVMLLKAIKQQEEARSADSYPAAAAC
jgi:hypothetical protein